MQNSTKLLSWRKMAVKQVLLEFMFIYFLDAFDITQIQFSNNHNRNLRSVPCKATVLFWIGLSCSVIWHSVSLLSSISGITRGTSSSRRCCSDGLRKRCFLSRYSNFVKCNQLRIQQYIAQSSLVTCVNISKRVTINSYKMKTR